MCRKAHFIAEGNFISDSDLMFRRERFIEKSINLVSRLMLFSGTGNRIWTNDTAGMNRML